jgi:hypothetical protein
MIVWIVPSVKRMAIEQTTHVQIPVYNGYFLFAVVSNRLWSRPNLKSDEEEGLLPVGKALEA